jgi:type IX secretion system PorP/SprF family membrane protein
MSAISITQKMPKMKHIKDYIVLMLVMMPFLLNAQQEPMYGQYIFNNSVINPAQAGAYNSNRFGVLARNQWLGIDGAPRTETAHINLKLPRQLGLAIGIYQDRLGPETGLQFQTDLAYHTRITDNFFLSGGIRLIASHLRVNLSDVPNVDPANPYFQENISSGLMFNSGAGLLAYTNKSYFGIAMPKVFRDQISIKKQGVVDFRKKENLHLFAYAGTNADLSEEILFMPSALFKYVDGAPAQLDLNAVFGYLDILDFGPLLRTNMTGQNDWLDAVGFLIGIRFLENWYLGYMYEYPLTDLRNATRQTHEISLRFTWDAKSKTRIRSPRYFL